jgi:hypothetical protein
VDIERLIAGEIADESRGIAVIGPTRLSGLEMNGDGLFMIARARKSGMWLTREGDQPKN